MALRPQTHTRQETVNPAGAVDECDMQLLSGVAAGFARGRPCLFGLAAFGAQSDPEKRKNTGAKDRSRSLLASRGVEGG